LKELWWIDNHEKENSINALVSFLKLCPALEQLVVMVGLFELSRLTLSTRINLVGLFGKTFF